MDLYKRSGATRIRSLRGCVATSFSETPRLRPFCFLMCVWLGSRASLKSSRRKFGDEMLPKLVRVAAALKRV